MRRTGYHVWAHGHCYWHRTIEGAHRRLQRVQDWASDAHIVEVATGRRTAS
jgi:hypothetical protein